MTRKNVLPATILVAATMVTGLLSATVLLPYSIGIASANRCSTNGGDGGDTINGIEGKNGDNGADEMAIC